MTRLRLIMSTSTEEIYIDDSKPAVNFTYDGFRICAKTGETTPVKIEHYHTGYRAFDLPKETPTQKQIIKKQIADQFRPRGR